MPTEEECIADLSPPQQHLMAELVLAGWQFGLISGSEGRKYWEARYNGLPYVANYSLLGALAYANERTKKLEKRDGKVGSR